MTKTSRLHDSSGPAPASRARRRLLFTSLLAALAVAAVPAAAGPPNIVFIVADDLGYADVGFQGGRDVPTPALDRLAAGGVRCTAGYVSGPYCSPTRAGLLTGRYQQRFGHEFNPGPPEKAAADVGLPLSERTLATTLSAAGYRTALVGKWHLGHAAGFHPLDRGFGEFYGFLGGAHTYLPLAEPQTGPNALLRGREPVRESEYLTRALAREAVAFIERKPAAPFFLLLAFNAVHGPLEPPTDADGFASITDPKRRKYAGMLAELDAGVGRVLEALDRAGVADDTLVAFISDNGGPPVNGSDNGSLRGYKASTWEGGIRVPFVVRWPGRLPGGTTFAKPVIQLDLLPTALAAAGVAPPEGVRLDGVDLVPHLAGKTESAPHERLFWRFGPQWAIRAGDWKLVKANGVDSPILVDLATDPGEETDRTAARPDVARQLEQAWLDWSGELAPPRWKPARNRDAAGKRAATAARPAS